MDFVAPFTQVSLWFAGGVCVSALTLHGGQYVTNVYQEPPSQYNAEFIAFTQLRNVSMAQEIPVVILHALTTYTCAECRCFHHQRSRPRRAHRLLLPGLFLLAQKLFIVEHVSE